MDRAVTAGRPDGPWVGDTVWDTSEGSWAVVTDVRQQGRDRPEYVLRHPQVISEQWATTDPGRLLAARP